MSREIYIAEFYKQTRYNTLLVCLLLLFLSSTLASLFNYLEPNLLTIYLKCPLYLGIGSLCLAIYLYFHPERIELISRLVKYGIWVGVFVPINLFVLAASFFPDKTLIDILPPPLFAGNFQFTLSLFIFLRHRNWRVNALVIWFLVAAPVLLYLLLHPIELQFLRGKDLAFAFGPALGGNLILVAFIMHIQELIEKLFAERIEHYEEIVERQTIRQECIEEAFALIHNGPLQTLALLLREARQQDIPKAELIDRLDRLNAEIRAIGGLTAQMPAMDPTATSETLHLGDGTNIDLDNPLHLLLREVYTHTLGRDLPHFQKVRVKVRDFQALGEILSNDLKRELCLWLEEALCNVGKHAVGATRITATGRFQGDRYVLKVEDNGPGLAGKKRSSGTKNSEALAGRLGGSFRRSSLPQGGTSCELSWPFNVTYIR
ncbi:MAG: sensor histidine kinase [Hormoscilla sp.]